MYKCLDCEYTINEVRKNCPICEGKLKYFFHKQRKYTATLPEKLNLNDDRNLTFGYFCPSCDKLTENKACLVCNRIGSLTLVYNNKFAAIKDLDNLSDVYTEEEQKEIAKALGETEKDLIYTSYNSSSKNIVKRSIVSFIAYLIVGLALYALFLPIAIELSKKKLGIAVMINALSDGVLVFFLSEALLSITRPKRLISLNSNLIRLSLVVSPMLTYAILATLFLKAMRTVLIIGFIVTAVNFFVIFIYEVIIFMLARYKNV